MPTENRDTGSQPADALFVYVPTRIGPQRGKREYLAFHKLFESEDRFVERISFYVIDTLSAQALNLMSRGVPVGEIDERLRRLFSNWEDDYLGTGLHPNGTLNALILAMGLSALGADRKEISVEWIRDALDSMKKDIKKPDSLELEAYFKAFCPMLLELPADTLTRGEVLKKVSVEMSGAVLADRMGWAAEVAYRLSSMGFDAVGEYKKYENDCFDFCMVVLAKARGEEYFKRYLGEYKGNSRLTIESERVGGTADYFWYRERGAAEALADMKKMDGCLVQTNSWTGSGTGEHWGIYYKGYVYHFAGKDGVQKTEVGKFLKRVKNVLCVIRPNELEEKQGRRPSKTTA